MKAYTVIVLAFGFITLVLLIILSIFNQLVIRRNKVERKFQNAYEYLEININLINKIIQFIKENLNHEESLIKKLEKSKKILEETTFKNYDINQIKIAEKELLKATKLEETYQFLNKKDKYSELKEEILKNKDKINYAFDSYDREVQYYNNYLEKRIINTLAKLFRFYQYDFYNK